MSHPDGGVEIELKFQVPPERRAALERALATATAERIELQARYFDTADGRLAAAQLALRLRREGGCWVQTLKGRGDGMMQRLEDEVPRPPEAGDPPPLDLQLHRGTPAGRSLARVLADGPAPQERYGTEIGRLKRVLRHGGARVEVALDVGDIVVGEAREPVCEVEFELLSGPLQGLLDLAARWAARFGLRVDPATKSERAQWLAAGLAQPPVTRAGVSRRSPKLSPKLPLAAARAAMVAAALAHALPNAAAITAGRYGPDHVHQLRVALRRLRSVLRAFGPADPTRDVARDVARDAALVALFRALSGTRDADVLALTLAPAWQAASAAGLTPPAVRRSADEPGPAALSEPSTTRLWLMLIGLTVPEVPGDEAAAAPWPGPALTQLRRWHRMARADAERWADLDDAARHRLRKRLKRLRYLLEFAAPLLPAKAARGEAQALRRLQEALGRWNDCVVARAWLATLDPADPARRFAEGWLAREALLVERACRRAADRWRRLDGQAIRLRRRLRR